MPTPRPGGSSVKPLQDGTSAAELPARPPARRGGATPSTCAARAARRGQGGREHRRRRARSELRLHPRPAPRRAGRAGRRRGLCFRNTSLSRPSHASRLAEHARPGSRARRAWLGARRSAPRRASPSVSSTSVWPIGSRIPSRWCSTETTFARSSATSWRSLISSPGRSPSRVRTTRKRPACVSPWRITWISSVGSMLPPESRTHDLVLAAAPCRRAAPRPRRRRRPRRAASSARAGARSRG